MSPASSRLGARRWLAIAAIGTLAALSTGCALQAPPYAPSIDNVERLKTLPSSMGVGAFSAAPGAPGATSISLRANSMESPVGADYAAYLAAALRQELTMAGKFDAASQIQIGGVLVKNDIAAAGISTNSGEIEARVTVKRGAETRFDKVVRAETSWESSFMGAIAIPKAQQQYPFLVQQLLRNLFSDADFVSAVK